MSMYLDLEDLMLDPFWNNQDEMLNTWLHVGRGT